MPAPVNDACLKCEDGHGCKDGNDYGTMPDDGDPALRTQLSIQQGNLTIMHTVSQLDKHNHLRPFQSDKNKFSEIIVKKGNLKKCLTKRPDGNNYSAASDDHKAVMERNLGDFIKKVPCGIIPKGTKLFHVTRDKSWVTKKFPGQHKLDYYSFFTFSRGGVAGSHGSLFTAVVQLELRVDVPGLLVNHRKLTTYYAKTSDIHRSGHVRKQVISKNAAGNGGGTAKILGNCCTDLTPVCIVSHSEREILLYSAAVPELCRVTGIAELKNPNKKYSVSNRKIVPFSKWPKERGSAWKPVECPPYVYAKKSKHKKKDINNLKKMVEDDSRRFPAYP